MDRILKQPTDNGHKDAPDPLSGVVGLLLETYIDEVPKVHKKLLQSIPQQSALFHNNCMYLTHWVAQHATKGVESCPSLVKVLQATGTKYLRVQIAYQESILMEIMSGFGKPPSTISNLLHLLILILYRVRQSAHTRLGAVETSASMSAATGAT